MRDKCLCNPLFKTSTTTLQSQKKPQYLMLQKLIIVNDLFHTLIFFRKKCLLPFQLENFICLKRLILHKYFSSELYSFCLVLSDSLRKKEHKKKQPAIEQAGEERLPVSYYSRQLGARKTGDQS